MVSEDGSPHGPKCFVLWNPPLTHMDAKKVDLPPLGLACVSAVSAATQPTKSCRLKTKTR